VKLGGHHIFSGNPRRITTGWVQVGLENEWQTMRLAAQFARVAAITWPLLRLCGYPVIPAARTAAGVTTSDGQPD
jgi:hypothetical protein